MSNQKQQLNAIAAAAIRTPTPSNCQPWQLRITDTTIELYHQSIRGKFASLPDDLSIFGLGMMAASLELAAQQQGLMATFDRPPLEQRCDAKPWLIAHFSELTAPPTARDQLLADHLASRHTDRREYAGGSPNDPVFDEMRAEVAAHAGTSMQFITEYPQPYQKLQLEADLSILQWRELRHDFMKWARFTEKERQRTQDGDSWDDLLGETKNLTYYLRLFGWSLMQKNRLLPDLIQRKVISMLDKPLSELHQDGAAIACITTADGDLETLFTAGHLAMRTWVLLNARGYAYQPLCNLTMFVYPTYRSDYQLPPTIAPYFEHAYAVLRETFGFAEGAIPAFCFRTGLPVAPFDADHFSLRRDDRIIHAGESR